MHYSQSDSSITNGSLIHIVSLLSCNKEIDRLDHQKCLKLQNTFIVK